MPELPEVETVRRALAHHVVGEVVTAVEGRPVQMRRPLNPGKIAHSLIGSRLLEPRRRGKYLLVDSDSGGTLMVHLGMSGRLLLVTDPSSPPLPHTHLAIRLSGGSELRLVDPRRFGLAVWLTPAQEARDPSLSHLGVEPLDPALPDVLPGLIRTRRAPVKALLLDQRLVAGVGNIYATEALWRARIRPTRPGRAIARARLVRLAHCLHEILDEAIAKGGTTIRDFAAPAGEAGLFAVRLRAYGREGQPCPECTTPLRRAVIAGRSTAWCIRCQR